MIAVLPASTFNIQVIGKTRPSLLSNCWGAQTEAAIRIKRCRRLLSSQGSRLTSYRKTEQEYKNILYLPNLYLASNKICQACIKTRNDNL